MGALFDLAIRVARRSGLVVGPIFLVMALGYTVHTIAFFESSITATGTVVSLVPLPGDDDRVSYAPVFSFVAANGQKYTVNSGTGSDPSEFHVDQSVPVLYSQNDPQEARLSSFWQLWTFPVVFGIFGTLLTGIGFGIYRYEQWRNRRGLSIKPS